MVRSPARFTAMPHQLSLDLSLRLAPAPTGERYGRHAHTPPRPVTLHRFDPGKRMARFYSLHIERDLFGGVVLRRQWGRIAHRRENEAGHPRGRAGCEGGTAADRDGEASPRLQRPA